MVRKKKEQNDGCESSSKQKGSVIRRNRASPSAIVRIYGHLTDAQKDIVDQMGFKSLLDIKCETLHNPLIHWLSRQYDPDSRSLVVHARGRIPLTEESVHQILGIPLGGDDVKYEDDEEAEDRIGSELFPEDGKRPKITRVGEMLTEHKEADVRFKRLWLIYIVSTLLAPTTSNQVSNKCYSLLEDINGVRRLNWCKFVVNELHGQLAKKNFNRSCLFYLMLRYVDCVDHSGHDIGLFDAPFSVNAWTREAVEAIVNLDVQKDGRTFGLMELKPEFSVNLSLFGGAAGFEEWMKVNTDPSCSEEERNKVSNLMLNFGVGLGGLLCNLVQGLTKVRSSGSVTTEHGQFSGAYGRSRGQQRRSRATEMAADPTEDCCDDESSFEDLVSDEGDSEDVDVSSGTDDGSEDTSGDEISESDDVLPDASIGVSDNVGSKAVCDNSAFVFPSQVPLGESSQVPVSDPRLLLSPELSENIDSDDNSEYVHAMMKDSAADLATRLVDMKRHQGAAGVSCGKIINDEAVVPEDSTVSVNKMLEESMTVGISGEKRKEPSGAAEDSMMNCGVDGSVCPKRVKVDEVLSTSMFSNKKSKSCSVSRGRQGTFKRQATRFSPRLAGLRSECELGSSGKPIVVNSPILVEDMISNSGRKENPIVINSPSTGVECMIKPGSSRTPVVVSPTVNAENAAGHGSGTYMVDRQTPVSIRSVGASRHCNVPNSRRSVDVPVSIQQLAANFVERRSTAASSSTPTSAEGNKYTLQQEIQGIEGDGFSVKEGVVSVSAGQGYVLTTPMVNAIKPGADMHTRNEVDNRLGMFTPPGFDLGIDFSSPAHSTTREQDVMFEQPLAWASPEGYNIVGNEVVPSASTDGYYEEMDDAFEMNEAFAAALDEIERELEATRGSQSSIAKENRSPEASSLQVVEETQRLIKSAGEREGGKDSKAAVEEGVFVHDTEVYGRSSTPKDQPRKGRVKMPSKYKLSPYDKVTVSSEQEDVYKKILGSCKNARGSKIKKVKIIQYESMWVYTEEFAESVKPRGELSNNMGEIGISYVRHHHKKEKKVVFSYLVARYLLEGNLAKKFIKDQFARERAGEKLSCQEIIMFPVLQKLGRGKDDPSHWYVLVLNLVAQRFEILDSLRDGTDKGLMEHASEIMVKIKEAWLIYYGQSKVQIGGYKLVCIETTKQDNLRDCGFFMVKFLELWDGQNVPAVSAGQIPNMKKVLTHNWLSSELNTIKNWKNRLDNNA